MKSLKFTVVIPPVGQKRARSRAVKTKNGAFSMTYKYPEQRVEEERLAPLLYEHRPPVPMAGPILLGVKAYVPMPKGKSKKWYARARVGLERPTIKPDLDNLIKHLKDLCNGVFWQDDKQVVGYLGETGKYYGDVPRWEIEMVAIAEGEEADNAQPGGRHDAACGPAILPGHQGNLGIFGPPPGHS